MIRAAFFACGMFVTLLGAAAVCVDRVVLTDFSGERARRAIHKLIAERGDAPTWRLLGTVPAEDLPDDRRFLVDPPDWASFAMLSGGVVTLLYALALPGRKKPEEPPDDGDDG